LSAHSELSSLSSLVNSLPHLVQQFNAADNFTFLAPTNTAISSWLSINRTQDYIQASLQYHLLNGTYPSASIPNTPIFIPSALTNVSYCNVTGGQRVKAYNEGQLTFDSGVNTTSNSISVDIIPFGGVIHTIDKVLELPIGAIDTFTAENLSYALALSNLAGFLSGESRPSVDAYFEIPNATYFVANSAKTLSLNFTGMNETTLEYLVNYDLVPQLLYSSSLVNGSQLMTAARVPVFVTVYRGDTYINSAKVTSKDNFITNGVFHVIDDVLDPGNITTPAFPVTSQSTNVSQAQGSKELSTGAKAGIGGGTAIGAILLIGAVFIFLYRRNRSSGAGSERNPATWAAGNQRKPEELDTNPWNDRPQLETMERAVELPA
ncbi:FAS1 domain-containing protein, partial [Stipitochalara longipes BDJ]